MMFETRRRTCVAKNVKVTHPAASKSDRRERSISRRLDTSLRGAGLIVKEDVPVSSREKQSS